MSKGKILAIDDNKLVLMGLQRVFEEEGYDIKICEKGKDAVELVRNEDFDIVFTDMKMPEMDGVEVCREIKKISPKTEVVVFSGSPHGIAERQMDFIESGGIDKFLRKPITDQEMIEVTEEILRKKKKES